MAIHFEYGLEQFYSSSASIIKEIKAYKDKIRHVLIDEFHFDLTNQEEYGKLKKQNKVPQGAVEIKERIDGLVNRLEQVVKGEIN